MTTNRLEICCFVLPLVTLCAGVEADPGPAHWPQWGGPNRDFTVETSGLADSWPENGPPTLWQRKLGDGYSSIAAEDGVLYTMYRKEQAYDDEHTIALDAKTGKTIWEESHPSPVPEDGRQFPGPNTTPLISGDHLFTIGRNAVMRCWNKRTGSVLWSHDLVAEHGAVLPGWGYSSSPIAYKDTIIAVVGTKPYIDDSGSEGTQAVDTPSPTTDRASLIAFDRKSGNVVWKSQDLRFQYSSPILINFAGEDQLIFLPRSAIVSVDPVDGKLLWQHTLTDDQGHVATPLWNGDDLVFSGGGHAGRVVKLSREGGKTVPKELWTSRRTGLDMATPVRIGDLIVTTKGGRSSVILGFDIRTGKRAWIKRGFPSATLVYGDGKIILLDEQGKLTLATATRDDFTVKSTWQVPDWSGETYAAPTLVGRTLYVRDRKHVMALDLG